MSIRRLDQRTIGKIAAGEVVERPASAVKELIENALDAGATRIDIELLRGGRELIQVTDNGTGITANDLRLAVERHTTSKLESFDDLYQLRSFGFRGEALASIAAVTDLTIVSRVPDQQHGARVRVRHGAVSDIERTGARSGTVVTARDLFANVPARAEFLRRDSTEVAYVQRVVTACAFAAPDVHFCLVVDGKSTLETDSSGDLQNTLVSILGSKIAAQMVPIADQPEDVQDDTDRPAIRVTGYIGLPAVTRGNRQQMFLTVNRRWIDHRPLNFAVEQAYHSLVMAGRFPIVVLNIDVPPERLDVNVHPTKREVRFSDERLVFSALQRAVRETLLVYTANQEIPQIRHSPMSRETARRRMLLADPGRYRMTDSQTSSDIWNSLGHESVRGNGSAGAVPAPRETPQPHEHDQDQSERFETERLVPVLRVLGQVGGNYIIAEGPEGMYLIDQHAAHERVLYERLLAQFHSGAVDRQQLLDAQIIELSPEQLATFDRCQDDLLALGFEIEKFGSETIAVRAVPAVMRGRDIEKNVRLILDEIASGGRGDSVFDSLVISAACHSSIRSGQTLTLPEMRELIVQLERCSSPRACGHGRPTMLMMSSDDLARQFERR